MKYKLIILAAILFCFSRAAGQCTAIFGNNNPACYAKTVNLLWLPAYSTSQPKTYLSIIPNSGGKIKADTVGNGVPYTAGYGIDISGDTILLDTSIVNGLISDTATLLRADIATKLGFSDTAIWVATKYDIDTLSDGVYGAIASIPTPTLQSVTTAGNTTTDSIIVKGINVTGFERAPASYDGGAAIYVRRTGARTGPAVGTVWNKSIHSYMERSELSIGSNSSFCAFDALSRLYAADTVISMGAIVGFQNNIIWDYPVGSVLDKFYGFGSFSILKTGTVNNAFDFYAGHLATASGFATVTNHFGLFIENFASSPTATNNWGVYQQGTGTKNYFAGSVGINDTASTYPLTVDGETSTTKLLLQNPTRNTVADSFLRYNSTTKEAEVVGLAGLSNTYFAQGGNSFGVAGTIGTNDAFALNFETNNVTRLSISSTGRTVIDGLTVGKGAAAVSTNVALGVNTLNNASTSGGNNVAVGGSAGMAITSGSGNTFIGAAAGIFTTTGSNNCALGLDALGGGTLTGSRNMAIGRLAIAAATSGSDNVGVGDRALTLVTQGSGNTGIGTNAGDAITTGTNNTFIGRNSGAITSTATGNTFIGAFSGYTGNKGDNNVSIGTESSYSGAGSTFTKNTILGYQAGFNLVGGGSNTYLGGFTGTGFEYKSKHIFISDGLGNVRFMADSVGNFGIATNTPTWQFTIGSNVVGINSLGKRNYTTGSNKAIGTATLSSGTVTVNNTQITASSLVQVTLQNCTNCGIISIGTITAATSFVINSSNVLDGSTVFYEIIN